MIAALKAEIEKLKRDIDEHIDRFPELKENRHLFESIKGIGPVMSRELLYLFAKKHFKNAKQAAAYAGLIPRLRESGTFKGRTTLSKIGPARLSAAYTEASGLICQTVAPFISNKFSTKTILLSLSLSR